jgi:hypothetical protein
MHERRGAWLVFGGLATSLVAHAVLVVLLVRHALDHHGAYPTLDWLPYQLVQVLDRLCELGLALGLGLWARATPRRLARVGFALAGGLVLLRWPAEGVIGTAPDLTIALSLVSLIAPIAFAVAARASGASQPLVWTVAALAGVELLFLWYAGGDARHAVREAGTLGPLAWSCLVLERLGGFPASTGPARIESAGAPRRAALGLGMVACAAGLALLGLAMWYVARLHADLGLASARGIAYFLTGAFVLWRLRRPLAWPIAVAISFTAAAGYMVLTPMLVRSPAFAALELRVQAPGLELWLPAGRASVRFSYQQLGAIDLVYDGEPPGVTGIGVWWRDENDDPSTRFGAISRTDHGPVTRTIVDYDADRWLYDSFRCGDDARWFVVGIHGDAATAELAQLLDRVRRRTACVPETRTRGERMAIPITAPPGYTAEPVVWMGQRFSGVDGVLEVSWYADWSTVSTLARDPIELLESVERIGDPDAELPPPSTLDWLEPLHVAGTERRVAEAIVDDRRITVTAWRCARFDIEVAAIHIGPRDAPREPILAAFVSGGCP